jgi:hypothetical protein
VGQLGHIKIAASLKEKNAWVPQSGDRSARINKEMRAMAETTATTALSGASSAAVAMAKLADLQKQVREASLRAEEEREALARNANLKGPSGEVEEFQKTVKKSSGTLQYQATDIGVLVKNSSRLNVVSSLAAKDKVDFYKFRVTNTGNAALSVIGGEDVRVQVLGQNGRVVADSNKDAGEAYERFQKLAGGELEMQAGTYTMRVTREKGVKEDTKLNYALQVRMGDYKKDYDTIAKQPAAGDDPYAPSAAMQNLQGMLNDSVSFLGNYQFGQSASEKLSGSLFNGLF